MPRLSVLDHPVHPERHGRLDQSYPEALFITVELHVYSHQACTSRHRSCHPLTAYLSVYLRTTSKVAISSLNWRT